MGPHKSSLRISGHDTRNSHPRTNASDVSVTSLPAVAARLFRKLPLHPLIKLPI